MVVCLEETNRLFGAEMVFFWSFQWRILWRYLSGSFSLSLLRPELGLPGLSEVPAGPLLSANTIEELCWGGSGLFWAPSSESLSSRESFFWLFGRFSPILKDEYKLLR